MLPIVVCTVTGRCLPVLDASVKAYCPGVELLAFSPKKETCLKSYAAALSQVFEIYDEVIVASDDIVLTPYSYETLIEDVKKLKELHGDKLGIVGAHSDFIRSSQNIRYAQSQEDKLEHCQWSWEREYRQVRRLSPIFHYFSKQAFEDVETTPIDWYSDDVMCEDLNAKGYVHYISRCYVHHAGSQTLGRDNQKLHDAAMPWLIKNRPQYLDLFFGEGARKRMEQDNAERKLRICVYAISKNEEQFVERFCESAKDADLVLIADTGSTDNTIAAAKACGAQVHSICITPWRFDLARNASLALVPRDFDVCVMMDLDEVLEPGWREEVERCWTPEATRMRYIFDWGHGLKFNAEKIHARHGYFWHHPCHEYPVFDKRINEIYVGTDKQLITHLPDESKSRGQYLELLELSVKEDPNCPRNAFYYARELFFYGRTDEAIERLQLYLNLPLATWHHERCYAMRVLSKCFAQKGDLFGAEVWALKSAAEAPFSRDPWCQMAQVYYMAGRWEDCLSAAKRALSVKHRELVYTADPICWTGQPEDFAAIALWNLGGYEEGLDFAKQALAFNPSDTRLQENVEHFEKQLATQTQEIVNDEENRAFSAP